MKIRNTCRSFALYSRVKLLDSDRIVDVAIGESMDENSIGQVDSTKVCFRFEVDKIMKTISSSWKHKDNQRFN